MSILEPLRSQPVEGCLLAAAHTVDTTAEMRFASMGLNDSAQGFNPGFSSSKRRLKVALEDRREGYVDVPRLPGADRIGLASEATLHSFALFR